MRPHCLCFAQSDWPCITWLDTHTHMFARMLPQLSASLPRYCTYFLSSPPNYGAIQLNITCLHACCRNYLQVCDSAGRIFIYFVYILCITSTPFNHCYTCLLLPTHDSTADLWIIPWICPGDAGDLRFSWIVRQLWQIQNVCSITYNEGL